MFLLQCSGLMALWAWNQWCSLQSKVFSLLCYNTGVAIQVCYNQVWCSNSRPESTHLSILGDPHSLEKYRVIGTISNSREFSQQFRCSPTSAMNPAQKCNIWWSWNTETLAYDERAVISIVPCIRQVSIASGVARSRNVRWTTGQDSIGGLEAETPAGPGAKLPDADSFFGACTSIGVSKLAPFLTDPYHPSPKKTCRICINSRNTLWQKWGEHNPSPPQRH